MLLKSILPIRAVTIRCRLLDSIGAPFFHQAQLKPFLAKLLLNKESLIKENGIWVDAVDSGRTVLNKGEEYRFTIFCTVVAYPLLVELLDRIRRLPHSYPSEDRNGELFGGNLEFIGLIDYFSCKSIKQHSDLTLYDEAALQEELEYWQNQESLILRFISPARFKVRKSKSKDEFYVCNRGIITAEEIEKSICNAISSIFSSCKDSYKPGLICYKKVSDRLFWTDNKQTIKNNKISPFGGALGDITLTNVINNKEPYLSLLVLAQYTGIGERRDFGMGRYYLTTVKQQRTVPIKPFSQSYSKRIAYINVLEQACCNIARKHPYIRKYIDYDVKNSDTDLDDLFSQKIINLQALSKELSAGNYQASILQGVILRKAGKHHRPLAVPPLEDRIVQRAVVDIMGVDLDKLSMLHSYGYRKGMSRTGARDQILTLNRQGYDWFFEADIASFFDLISFSEIENRLQSFFFDEPLVLLLMQWIKAPVKFNGEIIQRKAGLSQGSPISPMLANLMLEDFDSDLEAAGMKLIRFADDFVILCKNQEQANKAKKCAEQSLNEMGLAFNVEKTQIGRFSEGFDFLGYTFVSGLALENKRSNKPTEKLQFDNIPVASWLAVLLKQKPNLLAELNNSLDKKHRQDDLLAVITTTQKEEQKLLPSNEMGCTLFITPPCKILHQKNGLLEVIDTESKAVIKQLNWNDLNSIVIFGRHTITQYCQIVALENNIPVHYCSVTGKYQGVTTNAQPSQEGAGLWIQQIRIYTENKQHTLQIAKDLVTARIHNQIEVIRQRIRHTSLDQKSPVVAMQKLIKHLLISNNFDQLRGYEGQAAALYFKQIALWVPEEFEFNERNKRPPTDPFNALLSLGYSILHSHTCCILHIAGLYPWQGFYHQNYGRHMALASDLMEVFRHVVERVAMTVLRSGQIKINDFYFLDDASCRLTQGALKIYLIQLNARMLKSVLDKNYPVSMTMHEHLLRQANQLIRNIRDEEQAVSFFKLK